MNKDEQTVLDAMSMDEEFLAKEVMERLPEEYRNSRKLAGLFARLHRGGYIEKSTYDTKAHTYRWKRRK